MHRCLSASFSNLGTRIGVAVAVGLLARPVAVVAEVNLDVEFIAGYASNPQRQPGGESEAPGELGLTGNWVATTRHLSADVEGRVQGIKYFKDTIDDEVLGQLDGSLTWWAVPERFAWIVENVYGQVATDPFAPISPGNQQNTNFFSTGPEWYMPFGERVRGHLGGRYEAVRYEIAEADYDRLVGTAGIDRSVSASSRLGLRMSIESLQYDSAQQSDFDRHEAYVHYELSREQQTDGQSSGLMVNAGYSWLSGEAGDHSAPLLEVEYSQAVSSSVRLGLELASRFSDAGLDFAAGGLPGSEPGSDPRVIPQAGVFEERSGLATVDYRRERTILSFAVGLVDQLYKTATLDRRRYDAQLSVERRMTHRLTASADVLWSRDQYESDGLDREDTQTTYTLNLRRELGQRTSLAIAGQYASRISDNPENEFDDARVFLELNYSLR